MIDTDQRVDKAATAASEMANGVQEEVSMTNGPEPPHQLRLLVHLPSGAVMPVLASSEASARALREAIVRQCRLPQDASGLHGLALGHAR